MRIRLDRTARDASRPTKRAGALWNARSISERRVKAVAAVHPDEGADMGRRGAAPDTILGALAHARYSRVYIHSPTTLFRAPMHG